MSPFAQVTEVDHAGGFAEEETCDHVGSPERLSMGQIRCQEYRQYVYLIEVTSQPLATADLQMRDPRNPLPPATTIFFLAACDMPRSDCSLQLLVQDLSPRT